VPLVVRAERLAGLQKHLLLLYTGLSRTASEIALSRSRPWAPRPPS